MQSFCGFKNKFLIRPFLVFTDMGSISSLKRMEYILHYKDFNTINFINSTEKTGNSYYVDIFTRLNMTFTFRVKFLYC